MATPEGAKHRDLEQRLRDLDQKVRELAPSALRRTRLAVDQGDFVVSGGGSVVVEDSGDVAVNDGGSVVVSGGGNLTVDNGGDVDVFGDGVIRVWGDTSLGTMTDGTFGVLTLGGGGEFTYPSTLAQPDGFLCDAGPGKGYAVFRVDAASGKAVVSSSVGQVMLSYGTTSDAANTRILLDGSIQMVTSSRRYKTDIRDAEVDPAAVLSLSGRTWRDKALVEADPDTEARSVGFIAEELDAAGLTEFVDYDPEGRPDAIQYDRLTVALLAVAKDQQRQLDDLTARLDRLEAQPPATR